MGRWLGLASAACVVLAACEVPPTQLVVVVQTNMSSTELTDFRVRVLGPNLSPAEADRTYPHRELPASFGVAPRDGDANRRVEVQVDALRDDEVLFTVRAATRFIENHRLRLDVWLAARCVTEAAECGFDETCGLEECEPVYRDPDDLDDFDGLDAATAGEPDAGADAGALECGDPAEGAWAETAVAFNDGLGDIAGVARDPCGVVTLAGTFYAGATAYWHDGEDDTPTDTMTWISSWNRDGGLRWEEPIDPPEEANLAATALAADTNGDVWMGAIVEGRVDVSAVCTVGEDGESSVAVLRFTREQGECDLARWWPVGGFSSFTALSARDGRVLVAGQGMGLDFGLGSLGESVQSFALVLRDGEPHCQAAAEGGGSLLAFGADLGPGGDVLVGGTYGRDALSFGGHDLPPRDLSGVVTWLDADCRGGGVGTYDEGVDTYRTPVAFGDDVKPILGINLRRNGALMDSIVLSFDQEGNPVPQQFGSFEGNEYLNDVAVLPDGRVVAVGRLNGPCDLDGSIDTGGAVWAYLLAADAIGRTGLTTIADPDDSPVEILAVEPDPGTQYVFIAGTVLEEVALDGETDIPALHAGHANVFVARVAVPED